MNLSKQTFGQYRIIEPIGKGGTATIHKAYQSDLGRYVAINFVVSGKFITKITASASRIT